jgi:hypothetical protein
MTISGDSITTIGSAALVILAIVDNSRKLGKIEQKVETMWLFFVKEMEGRTNVAKVHH